MFLVRINAMQVLYKSRTNTIHAVTEAGPSAFANIKQNYYYVFVGCCAVYLVLIYFYFP